MKVRLLDTCFLLLFGFYALRKLKTFQLSAFGILDLQNKLHFTVQENRLLHKLFTNATHIW